MAKKKRKRARKSSAPAAKKRRRTKKRRAAASAAPKKRRRSATKKRRRARRASAKSPRKTRRRARRASASSAAPKRRRRARRASRGKKIRVRGYLRRKNPDGLPLWAKVGLAGLAGLASFALYGAGTFALTQRLDPSGKTLDRNRYIAGGMATVLGGAVALLASPVIGAGLFASGLISTVGTDLYLALGKVLDKAPAPSATPTAPAVGPTQQTTKGLYRGTDQQLNGLYQAGRPTEQQINGLGGLYRAGDLHNDAWMPTYQH